MPQHASGYPSFNPPASADLREENERLKAEAGKVDAYLDADADDMYASLKRAETAEARAATLSAENDKLREGECRLSLLRNERARELVFAETENATLKEMLERVERHRMFTIGDRVTKTKGSKWTGHVVGFYSTALTPVGYCVESDTEIGSVQIYPEAALAREGK